MLGYQQVQTDTATPDNKPCVIIRDNKKKCVNRHCSFWMQKCDEDLSRKDFKT